MLERLRRNLTYANAMSTIAVIFAVGTGSAYAANTVFSGDIADGEVKTADIADAAVTSGKVKNYSLNSYDIQANSLSSGRIAGLDGGDIDDDGLTGDDIDESSLKGLCTPGDDACKGAQGDPGEKGDQGDACLPTNPACVGPKGDPGEPGVGEKGDKGDPCLSTDPACVGPKGDKGDPGQSYDPDDTLAPGATQTGVYGLFGGATNGDTDSPSNAVNFRPQLAAPIAGSRTRIMRFNEVTADCPGAGQAAAGYLCIYEKSQYSASAPTVLRPDLNGGATTDGFVIYASTTGVGYSFGTWAVTAPLAPAR